MGKSSPTPSWKGKSFGWCKEKSQTGNGTTAVIQLFELRGDCIQIVEEYNALKHSQSKPGFSVTDSVELVERFLWFNPRALHLGGESIIFNPSSDFCLQYRIVWKKKVRVWIPDVY